MRQIAQTRHLEELSKPTILCVIQGLSALTVFIVSFWSIGII